jgi:hypothetical protein
MRDIERMSWGVWWIASHILSINLEDTRRQRTEKAYERLYQKQLDELSVSQKPVCTSLCLAADLAAADANRNATAGSECKGYPASDLSLNSGRIAESSFHTIIRMPCLNWPSSSIPIAPNTKVLENNCSSLTGATIFSTHKCSVDWPK